MANKKWSIRITNLTTLAVTRIPCRNKREATDLANRSNDLYKGRYLHEVVCK